MNKFEIVLIFSPDLGSQNLDKEIDNFRKLIGSADGKLLNEEDWGLRDLSYNINKFKKAFYRFFQAEIIGSNLKSIKNDLNQSETLLRYIFIKVNKHQELPTKLNYEKK